MVIQLIMALQEAMKEGYDEALLLDDEENISEALEKTSL